MRPVYISIHVILLMCIVSLCSCPVGEGEAAPTDVTILSWNVQNLMDGRTSGTEYEEYGPSSRWDETAYHLRLEDIRKVLSSRIFPDADIIVLQEVENSGVVADLIAGPLARRGYRWYAAAGQEGGAICTAIISRLNPVRITVQGVEGFRPALEAVFNVHGGTVVVWAVHAKSRKEGDRVTEEGRRALASLLSTRARLWRQADPGCLLVIAGDMNEDPGEEKGMERGYRTALVRAASSHAREWEAAGSLVVSGMQGGQKGSWYSPWLDGRINTFRPGSYVYEGTWHRYDHILFSGLAPADRAGWRMKEFGCNAPDSAVASDGTPRAWNVRLRRGTSDHFPVWGVFRFDERERRHAPVSLSSFAGEPEESTEKN
ncbi:endonuclease/exonuclease/phosphatase family protein [Parasphaerochaeta coccoides]|uniref:Endonuclease/exonuclease/phosphatase n=1 Tax=Parasphaerochaeta coccoides (strain ATCC BAA-1237 / DSM 17374 / SPN1) TaxID=760011 RepID=F4GI79_PARC1|nr:endonuclease/exonuclease/phosphatase family protein [Parasphaerochaeta coccoides]AEC02677.1 Endonuclease/exonuclease/phosphatase [Parasphaerochaeta coccoides DSM 17374]